MNVSPFNLRLKKMYLIAALIGAIIGARTAKKRKGSILDVAFYATGYCIAFALVSLIITLIIHRNFL
tara:strand:- start:19 stop:219 length:201 start_codon:yes stop_codon:yes gene_type:complete